jgi:hypothetical protein
MNTNTDKVKFTATLVTEDTKLAVIALRDESNLSEKELMTLVVQIAVANKAQILEQALVINADYNAAKAARKIEAYENLKAKLREAREAAKAVRAAKPKKEKPVKAPKPAKVADQVTA